MTMSFRRTEEDLDQEAQYRRRQRQIALQSNLTTKLDEVPSRSTSRRRQVEHRAGSPMEIEPVVIEQRPARPPDFDFKSPSLPRGLQHPSPSTFTSTTPEARGVTNVPSLRATGYRQRFTGPGVLRTVKRQSPNTLTERPWFVGVPTYYPADPEGRVDFTGEDFVNIPPNTIKEVLKNNKEIGIGYQEGEDYQGFPIHLVMPSTNVHPLIKIQAMSWILHGIAGRSGRIRNPYRENMPDRFFGEYINFIGPATEARPLYPPRKELTFIMPLLGAGGYQPNMEQAWRFLALLDLLLEVERNYPRVSALDLANTIYYHQPKQVRAYWDIINLRRFPSGYLPDDPNVHLKEKMDLGLDRKEDSGRRALVEAIQALRLFRRTSEVDPHNQDRHPIASRLTTDEMNFQSQRMHPPGDVRNYQIQCWNRHGQQTKDDNQYCNSSMVGDKKPSVGTVSIRRTDGSLRSGEIGQIANFSRYDYDADSVRYKQFRTIQFRPVEAIRNYREYCRALEIARSNPPLTNEIKEMTVMTCTGGFEMKKVRDVIAGEMALEPVGLHSVAGAGGDPLSASASASGSHGHRRADSQKSHRDEEGSMH